MGFGGTTTKGQRFPVEILTSDEVGALMEKAGGRYPCGKRDRALIAVLYRGGLRIAEALALYPKDVDLERGTVAILDGKGHKARTVAVDEETIVLVGRWLEAREKRGINGRNRLFCTLEGGPMLREQVARRLNRLAMRAGVEKRVHPHGLRHTLAAELADEKVDVRVIQAAFGHTNVSTTQTYINHLRPGAVLAAMRERKWQTK